MSETSDSGWSAPSLTIPWEAGESEPAEERERDSSQPRVTSIPADPYAVPVHFPSGYPYASWWRRFTDLMIDGAVLSVGWIALWFLFGGSFAAGRAAYFLADVAGGAYFTILSAGHRGQTPGMRATGIALRTKADGGALGYRRAIIRSALMSAFAAPGMLLFAVDCLFPLWQRDRQAIHDMVAGTVVVDVRHGQVAEPTAGFVAAPSGGRPQPDFNAAAAMVRQKLAVVFGFVRSRPARFWIAIGASVGAVLVFWVAVSLASSFLASQHSPTRSAIAYLDALSTRDVAGIMANAGIIEPATSGNTSVLLTRTDVGRELAGPGNALGPVSNVTVVSSYVSGVTASVTLQYVADNDSHTVTYSLIKSSHTSSGWAVQVSPSRLDIDVPRGTSSVTVAGLRVRIDGQVAHVYLFPAVVSVAVPASAVFEAVNQTIDTTHQNLGSDPQEVSLAAQLVPSASASAKQAVAAQISSCLAASSFTPDNCPNTDTPSVYSRDTYSGIAWSTSGDTTASLNVAVDQTGAVVVSGTVTASVSYTDTTPGDSFFGPVSNQASDGPFSWIFSYPLTWNGSSWVVGRMTQQSTT